VSELLHFAEVAGDAPQVWLAMVHGIFGRGSNLRTLARKIVERRSEWGVFLVDLREHGRSMAMAPPHDIHSAARDLAELAAALGREGRAPVGLIGHSLGGKVVSRAAELLGPELAHLWILDSSPSAKPDAWSEKRDVPLVLRTLEAVVPDVKDRKSFVAALQERGLSAEISRWLAMSFDDERGLFSLDLGSMRSLLESYYLDDVWHLFEDQKLTAEAHFVIGEKSTSLDSADRRRLRELERSTAKVVVHDIDAGHWLHAERPAELAALIAEHLPELE